MNELTFFHYLTIAWFIIAGIIFITLFFIVAPYGRHANNNWGGSISSTIGWIIMEAAAPLIFFTCFLLGDYRNTVPELIFLVLWEAHYIHRAFMYPFQRRGGDKPMPVLIIGLGFVFNAVNSYLNGRYIFSFSGGYPDSWIFDFHFLIGIALFIVGFIINRKSDLILRDIRPTGDSGYHIAGRGFFRWISCPNYLGEILIWIGWAFCTWSITGLSFAVWTAANLIPRARTNHLWYRNKFPDYPSNRKILIPGIW